APSVASGYEARLIINGLTKPRGIHFDNKGNLLVVERGKGVTAFSLNYGDGSCVSVKEKKAVVGDGSLNHGIEITDDGKTLYASNADAVFKFDYDSGKMQTKGTGKTIITGMNSEELLTRTILLSRKTKNKLVVSRGNNDNLDLATIDVNNGRSQIRIFDPSKDNQNYTAGETLGWGLRNAVAVAENPRDGGVWSLDNSADNIDRDGFEIHENNPAEELNYHGKLSDDKAPERGRNFGFPLCFAAWNISEIPSAGRLQIGEQFAISDENATVQDPFCRSERQSPRLVFQPHSSPLDMKFDSKGDNAFVTLHGSWNKEDPVGYSVSIVKFGSDGQPTEPSTSTSALQPILGNSNTTACPDDCFRPVGLAWDKNGRLYMSSDSTGEIYVIVKSGGKPVDESRPSSSAAS
ncbi:soluble quino protein glucose dehydrogenase, partial [Zopfia rhizophila CBS 207.26]